MFYENGTYHGRIDELDLRNGALTLGVQTALEQSQNFQQNFTVNTM